VQSSSRSREDHGLCSTQVVIDKSDISAPHDFGFQLSHYVIAPEVREGEKLVQIVRLSSGDLVKVDVVSRGTVEAPRLELTIFSREPLAAPRSTRLASGWRRT
jgi:hypothetical protein